MSSEALLETPQDRPCRADGQLLTDDLKDERSERVKRRELVEPCPRTEVRLRIDEPPENRIGLPEKLTRLRIGARGSLAGTAIDAHSWNLPLVNPQRSKACATRRSVHRAPARRRRR